MPIPGPRLPVHSPLVRLLVLLLVAVGALKGAEPAGEEILFGVQRAMLHREKQPDFRYHGLEYRRTGRWLGQLPEGMTQYLGAGAGRPERQFGSYTLSGFAGLRQPLIRCSHAQLYAQADSGLFLSDAHRRNDQRLLGQWLEFRTRVSFGLQAPLPGNRNLGALIECGYEHISNAGMNRRNLGADDLTFRLGVSWTIPKMSQPR